MDYKGTHTHTRERDGVTSINEVRKMLFYHRPKRILWNVVFRRAHLLSVVNITLTNIFLKELNVTVDDRRSGVIIKTSKVVGLLIVSTAILKYGAFR